MSSPDSTQKATGPGTAHRWPGYCHRERGYSLKEIRQCLKKADLRELACWTSLDKMEKPKRNTARVWFVARK